MSAPFQLPCHHPMGSLGMAAFIWLLGRDKVKDKAMDSGCSGQRGEEDAEKQPGGFLEGPQNPLQVSQDNERVRSQKILSL